MNVSFFKKYAQSLVALVIALVVVWFLLNLIHQKAPGVVGQFAGTVGELATGSKYNF